MALGDPAILQHTLSPDERAVLSRVAEALRVRFGGRLTKVLLFGSRARGDHDEESDVDLLIVVDALSEAERDGVLSLIDDAKRATGGYVPLAPIVLSATLFAAQSGRALGSAIQREGIPL